MLKSRCDLQPNHQVIAELESFRDMFVGECQGNMVAAKSTEKFHGRALVEGFIEFVNAPSFNRPSFPKLHPHHQ
ncbi:hypothetical protein AgCh_034484 [Apium graveolens]